ncbi:hypothetical protein SERLA73DRAFT_166398 [Serpula lacrymans var. lacrymans S7.3]|uniref:Uncharacterized protein n=2 Tax=Serpula lacrymans var. lacrymans TaxID=341189 RepID=F8PP09_SERL3|nr:uncharacterized protein SERLADRAFT_461090 [Serpula lacrymans var. lacrymans S7.9]EGO01886.1 hypothetical protein SERLA73DRAFT_166398 [Serpula lacrymans var. lacrymans S7.3]EGO27512.1 hypothetical protein SERLADRAFT_461090 [Serpula lacrymans var. lacrymans S7.9]
MEFSPRYSQPFTLEEAIHLDLPVITEEIARLENSLLHLGQTQEELREYTKGPPPSSQDPDILQAIEENEITIGSQQERVLMLKLALTHKGVPESSGAHYDFALSVTNHDTSLNGRNTSPTNERVTSEGTEEDGVYL